MEPKARLYPTIPTAPPDAEMYRLSKISEIQQFLQSELCVREGLFKKYKKGLNSLQIFDGACLSFGLGATAGSLALLMTGVGAPIAIGLQSAGIATGVVGVVGKLIERKVNLKIRKHDEIKVLAQAKLSTIADKISKAFEDGCISDSEFRAINFEQKEYCAMKKEIQARERKAMATGITAGEKKKIVEEALQNMLKMANHNKTYYNISIVQPLLLNTLLSLDD